MTQDTPHDILTRVLTPALFHRLHDLRFPWPKDQPLDGLTVGNHFFGGIPPPIIQQFRDLTVHPVLIPLSRIPLDSIPSLLPYLGPPTSHDFPIHALGLVLLLDQMPRMLLQGTDERYTNSFFDPLAVRLRRELSDLPVELRPESPERWEALGYGFEHSAVRRSWVFVTYVHSEELRDQNAQLALTEELRAQVETFYGVVDPSREFDEADSGDLLGFARLVMAWPPEKERVVLADYLFYIARLFRVHEPIIRRFRRYPYRNGTVGRDATEEEVEWLEATDGFGMTDEETARKIREDVAEGRWEPLRGE